MYIRHKCEQKKTTVKQKKITQTGMNKVLRIQIKAMKFISDWKSTVKMMIYG